KQLERLAVAAKGDGMGEVDLVLTDLGEIYKCAHDIAMRTSHPLAHEILNLCNQLASQYEALRASIKNK
ncbi:unnamed protein product, partial [marine sediment metagenome]